MADNNQPSDEMKSKPAGTSSTGGFSGTIGNHENAVVPHMISNHDKLVQTMVMVDGEWINLNDTNDQANMKKDLHRVNKQVVEAQKGIVEAKNAADSAVNYANSAISASKVNSDAIVNQESAINAAKSAAASVAANIGSQVAAVANNVNSVKSEIADATSDIASIKTDVRANSATVYETSNAVVVLSKSTSDAISNLEVANGQVLSVASSANGNATVAKQTADSAVAVAKNAQDEAVLAKQSASAASVEATNANSAASRAEVTVNGFLTRVDAVEKSNQAIDQKVTYDETLLNQTKEALSGKVDQTTFDETNKTVNNLSTSFGIFSNQLKTVVTDTQLDNYVKDKKLTTESTVQSIFSQKAKGFNESIIKLSTELDNNNGGGVNLATNTKDVSLSGTNGQQKNIGNLTVDVLNSLRGQMLTISVDVEWNGYQNEANKPNRIGWEIQLNYKDGSKPDYFGTWLQPTSANGKQRISATYTIPDKEIASIAEGEAYIQIKCTSGKVFHLKAERGSVATPYSAAPADNATVTQFQSLTTALDGLQSTVQNKVDKSTYTQLASLVESKVSNSQFTSAQTQLADAINARVQKGNVLSQINVEAGRLLFQSNKIYFDADTFVLSPNSKAFIPSAYITEINADKITTGTLDADKLNIKNFTADNIKGGTLDGVKFRTELMNDARVSIMGDRIAWTSNTSFGEKLISWFQNNGTGTDWISLGDLSLQAAGDVGIDTKNTDDITRWTVDSYDPYDQPGLMFSGFHKFIPEQSKYDEGGSADDMNAVLLASKNTYISVRRGTGILNHLDSGAFSNKSIFSIQKDNKVGFYVGGGNNGNQVNVQFAGDGSAFNIHGNFNVYGAKNSAIKTSQGDVAISAYETAEYYFGDIGKGNTGDKSKTIIGIEKLFNETVNTTVPYQVFLTTYGPGNVWVSKRNSDRFVVESDRPNVPFGFEIKAKRKGYENTRLQKVMN